VAQATGEEDEAPEVKKEEEANPSVRTGPDVGLMKKTEFSH